MIRIFMGVFFCNPEWPELPSYQYPGVINLHGSIDIPCIYSISNNASEPIPGMNHNTSSSAGVVLNENIENIVFDLAECNQIYFYLESGSVICEVEPRVIGEYHRRCKRLFP